MSYNKIGLNEFLQPINSPVSSYSSIQGYTVAASYERNAIDIGRIKNFSFNAGTGGTLILGGPGNGNGVQKINDASGSLKVLSDNTGITVYDGRITIYNTLGSAAVDASGVVSVNNFAGEASINDAVLTTYTGTAATDVSGGSLSFVLERSAVVLILANINAKVEQSPLIGGSWSAVGKASINVDGTTKVPSMSFQGGYDTVGSTWYFGATHLVPGGMHHFETLAAGTHTVKLQAAVTTPVNNGAFYLFNYKLSYMIFGR